MSGIKSIKTIFALSMILMTVVVFSLQTGFSYYQFSKVLEEKVIELLENQARHEATKLKGDFSATAQTVESLAQTIEALNSYDTEKIVGIMRLIMSKGPLIFGGGFWLEPFLYNDKLKYYGPYIYRTGIDKEYQLTWDYSNEKYDYFKYDWYKEGFAPNVRVVWSEPYIDEVSGVAMMTATSPIRRDGKVIGVTTIDVGVENLISYVNSIKTGKSGYGFLVSSQGMQVASLVNQQEIKIKNTEGNIQSLKEIAGAALGEEYTGIRKTVLNEQEVMVVFTPIGETGLRLVMVMPVAEAFASVHWMFIFSIIGFLLSVTLLTVMIFRLFEHKVALPLQELAKYAERISKGDFTHAIQKTSEDEIGQLCHAFNTMSKTIKNNMEVIGNANRALQQAHDELEVKVEIRTQDLLAMNEEMKAINEELAHTLENLRETQLQLVQSAKMASLGSLVAGVAHEINTPIGVGVTAITHLQEITKEFIQLYEVGELKRQDLKNYLVDCDEAIKIIFSNLERASHLIRSFKQVSVDQSNEVGRVFHVKKYLDEILLSLQPKLKRTQHIVTIQCDEELKMDSYPGAFAQIITNLVVNSLVHAYDMEAAGEIKIVVVKNDDNKICLTYSDNGKGMEPAVVEKIFNPFFTTKRGRGGTGLGLSILYNIITQQFGGTIECSSTVGKGTTFIIQFPIITPSNAEKKERI